MRSPALHLYHLEGAARPNAVRWLTDTSIVVSRTTGSLEIQRNFEDPSYSLYRGSTGIRRIDRIPGSSALFALGGEEYEIICESSHGLISSVGRVPTDVGAVGACVVPHMGLYMLASRDGTLWKNVEGEWSTIGKLTLRDVTSACALPQGQLVFGSAHGEIEIVNTVTPFVLGPRQRVHADSTQDLVAISNQLICTVSRDRALRVWRLGGRLELLWSKPGLHEHFINCLTKVGDEVWTGSSDGSIAVTSLVSRELIKTFKEHSDSVRTLDCSSSCERIISLSDDGTYVVYDIRTKSVLKRFGELRRYIRSGDFLFLNEERKVAVGSTSGSVLYGDLRAGTFKNTQFSAFSVRAVRFLDPSRIVSGDETGTIRIFDITTGRTSTFASAGAGLTLLKADDGGDTLICGYRDGYIRIFRSAAIQAIIRENDQSSDSKPDPAVEARIHTSIVGDVLCLGNGLILSCSDDQTIKTSLASSLEALNSISLDGTAINNLAMISDALIATTDGGSVFVLDSFGHTIRSRYLHGSPVRAIAQISESIISTGDRQEEVRIWNIVTLETLSINQFRERIIELKYDPVAAHLYVITEAEIGSLGLDPVWLSDSPSSAIAADSIASDVDGSPARAVDTGDSIPGAVNVADWEHELASLDIEITKMGAPFGLRPGEDRLVRAFAKRRGGARCEVAILGGGLTDARVFRAKVLDGFAPLGSTLSQKSARVLRSGQRHSAMKTRLPG